MFKTETFRDSPVNPNLGVCFTTPELWKKLNVMAKQKRREPTFAENKLWQFIRDKKVKETRFGRQHTIERFIVDFACVELKLIIEVDGETREYTKEEDEVRQSYLESEGFKILHVSTRDVMNNINAVLKRISNIIAHLHIPSALEEG